MRDDLVWTDVTPREIAASLNKQDIFVGPRIVRRVLDTLGFARRQIAKVIPGGETPFRAPQCRHLAHLIQDFQGAGNPVLRIDTKKKECLGTLYRKGKVYCQESRKAFDHDFASVAQGLIIPHGIYDLSLNHGWLHVGRSRDTTECAGDSLRLFWQHEGRRLYPQASAILLLCAGGGRNSCRKHLLKEDLQSLANALSIPIRVAHYPAYCSKCTPIERRLFCHVTRACQGVLFDSMQTVGRLMQKTATRTGLSVTVRVMNTLYETGRKVSDSVKQNMPIVFEPVLPKWNYWAMPQ